VKTTQMKVELLDHMGTDISVVNAARVSFSKESEYKVLGYTERYKDGVCIDKKTIVQMEEGDKKLLRYLAEHNHWSPFSHAFVSFRIKAPIFVARQLAKHQVGLAWNEVSRRYVDYEPEIYMPDAWRAKPEGSIKQGSSEISLDKMSADGYTSEIDAVVKAALHHTTWLYDRLIDNNVAPEQARMVLPQNAMTEWIWSGSLYAFARVCNLRLDKHAQKETQEVAGHISTYMQELFPVSWSTLKGEDNA